MGMIMVLILNCSKKNKCESQVHISYSLYCDIIVKGSYYNLYGMDI